MNKFFYNKPKYLIHNAEFEIPTKLRGLLEKKKKKTHKFFSLIRWHPSYP